MIQKTIIIHICQLMQLVKAEFLHIHCILKTCGWSFLMTANRISSKMLSSYYFSLPQPFLFVFLITVVDDKVEVYAVTHCVLVMHVGPSVITSHQHSSKHRSPEKRLVWKKNPTLKKNCDLLKKNCADVLKKIHTLSHATMRRRERKGISIISPMMTFCHREAYIYIC